MTTLSQTKELFRRADAVCFDVDSTVIKEEGIDELAKFCGVGDAVREMCVCDGQIQNPVCVCPTDVKPSLCHLLVSGPERPWAAR